MYLTHKAKNNYRTEVKHTILVYKLITDVVLMRVYPKAFPKIVL